MADKAILFGINDYKSISDLRGCLNDVENIERLLEQSGFSEIRTYRDDEVVRRAIVDGFDWLVDGAAPGDRLVFHISSHGSYIPSSDDDEDTDELICLYDMNWDDPDTYLLDDDLGKLTQLVPEDVRLTVILDCCHSGTGTRALTRELRPARASSPRSPLMIVRDTAVQLAGGPALARDVAARLMRDDAEPELTLDESANAPVLARFVEPPARLRKPKEVVRYVRRLGDSMRAELNHQLLAAAADTETAADAFINGEFNGAFSYYLCEAARELGRSASFDRVMQETVKRIKTGGYSQTPQIEGPFGSEALFGGQAASHTADVVEDVPEVDSMGAVDAPKSAADPLSTLNRLLHVSEKLVDLAGAREARVEPVTARAAEEVVVYVHGIGQHTSGFSRPWSAALAGHLARRLPTREVVWSHHVNARAAVASSGELQACAELAREIEAEIQQRAADLNRRQPPGARGATVERPRGERLAVDDFTRYMLIESTRNAILGEFDEVVRDLLGTGQRLHIISHSWGTVVAYEGLRRLDAESFPGHVANLFTVGSALSIGAVQANLFGRVNDGRRPALVRRLINLDAGGDVVGGGIGDAFLVDREFLGLFPTGCRTIPFTSIALNPSCAHSSYFRSANRDVNRDIFARFINPA